jgi:hypothetical protein
MLFKITIFQIFNPYILKLKVLQPNQIYNICLVLLNNHILKFKGLFNY